MSDDAGGSATAERGLAGAAAGVSGAVEVAELHAPFTHQELVLRRALGLGDDVQINPSGGALAGNSMFAGGLTRIGEAANRNDCLRAGLALAGRRLEQHVDRVLLRLLDEATRVDHRHVGVVRVVDQEPSLGGEPASADFTLAAPAPATVQVTPKPDKVKKPKKPKTPIN